MMSFRNLAPALIAALCGCWLVSGDASAQKYPSRTISMVVPFPPGGLSDVPARILAPDMQALLGAPVVVENKPGGSGVVGASYVWRADPDGYTLLVNAISDVQNLHYLSVPYNAVTDVAQIGMVTDGPPLVLLVNAETPYRSLADIIADSKAHPDKVSFASSGPATSPAIAINQLNALAGSKILEVPYRGTAPAGGAIIAGEVQGGFLYFGQAKQLHEGGRARAIAITSAQRFAGWPELPTMAELGFPPIVHTGFVGLSAPSKTPTDVIALLNKTLNTVIDTPAFRKRMEPLGMSVPAPNTPETLRDYMRRETANQAELAKLPGHPPRP
jgi:tripartite-type tricarboxylate transporter receptor subunit TctC